MTGTTANGTPDAGRVEPLLAGVDIEKERASDAAECGACGADLDAACDHCCAACLGGESCPACDGSSGDAMAGELARLVRQSTQPAIPAELFRSAVDAWCEKWAGYRGELPESVVLRAVEGW